MSTLERCVEAMARKLGHARAVAVVKDALATVIREQDRATLTRCLLHLHLMSTEQEMRHDR